ncbi:MULTISPECIES: IclR family transcriptional regulator [Bradyrhizobium]|uniref:IclR family transcriptional regulator n=1 Tax=Bradyrhizobium centrosematis TaxID=1300039 RepID=UPI00216A4511|nr:IclR family transcriptional regulator [Bradyrhizobium centrosematis]MCS3765904.1 DNA-binding IclR family transcriptional regulator [Bradyrhizobium centrosematis]MCS3778194.1 DNA-binding IclR family transcriptional regulator [Bradyrhizobium centrosematis]
MNSGRRSQSHGDRTVGEVTTVQRAIDLLRVVGASEKPSGVNEIARRLGKHVSAVSRTLATLGHNGFAERNEETGRFVLGVELIALASRLLAELDVVRVARPYLEELARSTRETASLSLWNKTEAINIEHVLGPGSIKHIAAPGRRNPAHCTASGKAMLSQMPGFTLEEVLTLGLESFTDRTITDPSALERELCSIRERGYALNVGEFIPEIASIAAVVLDRRGRVAAAIAITMPVFHFTQQGERQLAPVVMNAAATISQRLGHRVAKPSDQQTSRRPD